MKIKELSQLTKSKTKYINPNIINFVLFCYFIVLPFIAVDNKNNYTYAFIIALIGFFSFSIGYKVKINEVFTLKKEFNETQIKEYVFYLYVLYDLFLVGSLVFNGLNQNAYNIDFLERAGSNTLYLMIISNVLNFTKYYIYSFYLSKTKGTYWTVFIITLLASFTSRQRFDMVAVVVFFAIYGVFYKYIKITFSRIMALLLLFPIFTFSSLIKRDFVGQTNMLSLIKQIQDTFSMYNKNNTLLDKLLMSMESFSTFDVYNNVIKDSLITPLNGIFRIFFNFIPRSIWENKPLPSQAILAFNYNMEAYLAGGGIFANIFGDAYLNGGLLGVIVILFVIGLLAKHFYNNAQLNITSKPMNVGLYCMFVVFFLSFYRGLLSDRFWEFLLLIITFKLLNMFEKKVAMKNVLS